MGIYVLGVGQVEFGECRNLSAAAMAQKAAGAALLDSGLSGSDIGAVYFSGSAAGRRGRGEPVKGESPLRARNIGGLSIPDAFSAAVGGSAALHRALTDLGTDLHEVALVIGVDRSVGAGRVALPRGGRARASGAEEGLEPAGREALALEAEARAAAEHMGRFGTTREQLARIAAKNRFHGTLNPRARHELLAAEDVLASPPVEYPLTRAMCAFAGGGAAAVIVCSGRFLRRLGSPRPVRILASVASPGHGAEGSANLERSELAGNAWELAGLGPNDVDCAELHDTTAYAELRETELLGFCREGEGGSFAASGASTLGGTLPINTSGGLLCRGYAPNASGLVQICEIVAQLRGEACRRQVPEARIGLALDGCANRGAQAGKECLHLLEATYSSR